MIKSIEVSGKTEDEALSLALSQLGLDRDDVSVEILERAKSGFLGIGSTPAKVKVSYEAKDEEKPVEKIKKKNVVKEKVQESVKLNSDTKVENTVAPEEIKKAARETEDFLVGLFKQMNCEATPVTTIDESGNISIDLVGEKLGNLIGRRGETLDAIQHLANYAINRGGRHIRISIDAENYRSKREESLRKLAEKMAAKVQKSHRNISLEPMNSYERHIIHATLQDYKGITTYSMNSEPNRRVVIAYEKSSFNHSSPKATKRNKTSSVPATNDKPTTTPTHVDSNVREWC